MHENGLHLAIKEFGQNMGIADLHLDLSGSTSLELETGETFNLEIGNNHFLIYLAIEVLPYIASRVLEKLYLMANHHTHGDMPFMVGLYQSNIIICMHLDIETITGLNLIKAAENIWELRMSSLN